VKIDSQQNSYLHNFKATEDPEAIVIVLGSKKFSAGRFHSANTVER
jgi:hypothetical protein